MSARVRLAVVGAGYMGRLHAEKAHALAAAGEPIELVGIADIGSGRARALAERCGGRAVEDFRELLPDVDAAIVAVPTLRHFEVVRDSLQGGLDVLVEKPIAATLEEAEELLALAESRGRVLQVGHLEWFNAALAAMRGRIARPRFAEASRVGPFPARGSDVDVVRDLMIHDLDILQQLVGEEPERIEAIGVPVLSENVDIANARLTFPSGCVANVTASRVSPVPLRRMHLFQRDGCVSIDFLEHSAAVFRRAFGAEGASRIEVERLALDRSDPLLEQLRDFVSAARRRSKPRVGGADGLSALRTALRVVAAMPPPDELR
jgi:predicted dehydrogenase